MIIGLVRFSYAAVFEAKATPSGDMKYSVSVLIPKSDTKLVAAVQAAISEAANKGVEKGKYNKLALKTLRSPLRDGDAESEDGSRGPEYKGHLFFNASSVNPPGVVGPDAKPLLDQQDFYSGCYGYVDVNFFPYNTAGNKGVGAGLNNVMKKKDGERLDGRMKAEDAFAAMAEVPEPSDEVDGF